MARRGKTAQAIALRARSGPRCADRQSNTERARALKVSDDNPLVYSNACPGFQLTPAGADTRLLKHTFIEKVIAREHLRNSP